MPIDKVTDPQKIVTDPQVLNELARQGIDKDYVEFWRDYAPEHPCAKFYRDLKSNKRFMVVSGLLKVDGAGNKIEVGWTLSEDKYFSKANRFSVVVEGTAISLSSSKGTVAWQPQLFLNDVEVAVKGKPAIVDDPDNENYSENVLEWDYGICKRRLRLIHGAIFERWLFESDPQGEVRIKHNQSGTIKLRFSGVQGSLPEVLVATITEDEEIVSAEVMASAVYPVMIGADTFYPDANSVDGTVLHSQLDLTWSQIVNAGGTDAYPTTAQLYGAGFRADPTVNLWRILWRGFVLFDTSSLPDDATITDVVFSIYGYAKVDGLSAEPSINVYASNPASDTNLVGGDYDTVSGTAFCDIPITYAGFNTSGYNDFTFNASGIASVSKTGVSKYVLRTLHDVSETAPPWLSSAYSYVAVDYTEMGEGYQPKLVVTYEGGATEKSSSDSGTGSDAKASGNPLAMFTNSETGSGTESSEETAALSKSESGTGADSLLELLATILGSETGSGVDEKASYPLVTLTKSETGSGVGTSALMVALLGSGETGLGSDLATKYTGEALSASDSGSGIDVIISRLLEATETGSGVEVADLVVVFVLGDGGTGADVSVLPWLKDVFGDDEGSGYDALKALIKTAVSGSDMRLHGRAGQVKMPSKGVNL